MAFKIWILSISIISDLFVPSEKVVIQDQYGTYTGRSQGHKTWRFKIIWDGLKTVWLNPQSTSICQRFNSVVRTVSAVQAHQLFETHFSQVRRLQYLFQILPCKASRCELTVATTTILKPKRGNICFQLTSLVFRHRENKKKRAESATATSKSFL